MIDVSVIICTHNPRPEHLRRVLEALGDQTLPEHRWELQIIDNGSKVPLALTLGYLMASKSTATSGSRRPGMQEVIR